METLKQDLLDTMRRSIENATTDKTHIVLFIHMPTGETEMIINPNLAAKMAYIERAYDDDLHLKSCPDICIEDYEVHEDYRKDKSDGFMCIQEKRYVHYQ